VEVTDEEVAVLRAIATLNERDQPVTVHGIARLAGSTFAPVRVALNQLMMRGLVTPSLQVTEQGQKVLPDE
jgi:Mn-dependent DtxR family transcriptional regulator